MKVLNYGSLNYDYVYTVPHIVTPGETLLSGGMEIHCGGKGLNQSIAMARAGVKVFHAGMVGEEGEALLAALEKEGVDCGFISSHPGKSGHAIIQVNSQGENCILLYKGANGLNSYEKMETVLKTFDQGDLLVVQNEVNGLADLIGMASKRGMKVVMNPSPFNELILACDLSGIYMFVLNEIEGYQMTGERETDKIMEAMARKFPQAQVVLTLGKKGVCYQGKEGRHVCPCFAVEAVDTTAAGDTFTGYLIGGILKGISMEQCLKEASAASAIAVTREGAAASIPVADQVRIFLDERCK